ncbi:MAG: AAA family ATPase [Chloroflexi bacterium]|nr:AAA family ATPase [Chloroflexota bacterium]
MAPRSRVVAVRNLRRTCDPRSLRFKTTAELAPLEGTVGQDRAVAALDFGLGIEADGFNVFVSGLPGSGRSTEVRARLAKIAPTRPRPCDWCYVFNFAEPARPRAMSLPADRGHQLSHDIDDLVAALRTEIPRAFESDEYARRRDQVNREVQSQRERLFETLEAEARARGLAVSATPMGISTAPLVDGKPITKEQYDALAEDRKHQLQEQTTELDSIIAQMAPQLRRLDRSAQQLLLELNKQLMLAILTPRLEELKRDYLAEDGASAFLRELGEDILGHIDEFRGAEDQPQPPVPGLPAVARDGVFDRYKVNVLVTHATDADAPVVIADSASYYHLFGRIDYRSSFGSMVTDHTMMKPGALHRANGGFLVVQALDVLTAPLVWDTLKRALRNRQIRLENMGEQFSVIPTASLSPEPIPLNVKVVMIGTNRIFQLLQNVDEDFQKLFKARADFTTDVQRNAEHSLLYARFIAHQAEKLGTRPFDAAAVARVIEQSSRMVADQEKLSIRMMDIVDLLVEADYWACDARKKVVSSKEVEKAIDQKVYRSSLIEDRVQEFLTNGVIKVTTDGECVGQVNGLSVYDLGDYAFGRPSRITARVSMGRGQVINFEREIQKSGPSHSKGFLILQGYLNGKFAHRQPLSFAATITFEQVYDEVDGDSASSTELYALLSAITDIPLRQGIAVTGSVNQLGEVQAIGGVNEKIEGFFAVCKARGFTGDQGVMIPRDNVRNLMLKPEVVQAVARGRFHVWSVSTIDEGIELLTGMPAGRLRKDQTYPLNTVFRRVTDALESMTQRAMEVNRGASAAVAPTSVAPGAARRERPGGGA